MTEKQRQNYFDIAYELGYSDDTLTRIRQAKTTVEAENILVDARKKGDSRNGKSKFTTYTSAYRDRYK